MPEDLDKLAYKLSRSTLPLALTESADTKPWQKVKRGTFTLIMLPDRHVFVTCCHVLDEYRRMQAINPGARIEAYLTSATRLVVLHGFHHVDDDRSSLDVAIFRGDEDEIELPGMHFIDYEKSLLPDPQPGEPVLVVGYPGENVVVKERRANFGIHYAVFGATTVSDRQILLANTSGQRVYVDYEDPSRKGICLGGISGGAAFILRDGQPRFVGIVKECGEGGGITDRTIAVARLSCMNSDGRLDHNAIPW